MCRYEDCKYKGHWACFNCRKQFRDYDRKTQSSGTCPQCSEQMTRMGLDFKPPPRRDIKSWNKVKQLAEADKTFISCGCNGPGYGLPPTVNSRIRRKWSK